MLYISIFSLDFSSNVVMWRAARVGDNMTGISIEDFKVGHCGSLAFRTKVVHSGHSSAFSFGLDDNIYP